MTTRVTRTDVEAVAPQRWRIGLFENSGANQLPTGAIQRLAGGIGYQPIDPALDPAGQSFDPCGSFEIVEDEAAAVEWNAWGVAIGEECSTLNGGQVALDSVQDRAESRLLAQRSYLGEYTFWTGIVGASDFATLGWPNIPLTDVTSTDLTPSDGEAGPVEAFGLINEYLSDTLRGLRGCIHVAPQILPYLSFYGLVQRDGFTLGTTLGDHLVIAGSGYQGNLGPGNVPVADNRNWIYATSMPRVGVSQIDTHVDVDRTANTAKAVSYGAVLAEWDRTAHAAVKVCLTDPGPTCATEGS